MVRSISYKILAVALSFLVLLSSMATVINIHYCQQSVKDISLYSEAKHCSEQDDFSPCLNPNTSCEAEKPNYPFALNQTKCCTNVSVLFNTIDKSVVQSIVNFSKVKFVKVIFLTPLQFSSDYLIDKNFPLKHPFKKCFLSEKGNLQSLFQVFLL